ALNRTGGTTTTTTTTSQEAKDFKVVVTLDNPPPELRPGLSATASIVTATRQHVLAIPIQALTIREFDNDAKPGGVEAVKADAKPDPKPTSKVDAKTDDASKSDRNKKKIEKEGVFIVKDGSAAFREVKPGITGTTDLEILNGLSENEEI